MRDRIAALAKQPHKVDRLHTVCMLCVIQFLLIAGATTVTVSAVVTALIFARDANVVLMAEEFATVTT